MIISTRIFIPLVTVLEIVSVHTTHAYPFPYFKFTKSITTCIKYLNL